MKIKICTLIILGLILFFSMGLVSILPSDYEAEHAKQSISNLGISEGELKFVGQKENSYGKKQYTYTDNIYTYILDANSSEVVFTKLNTDKMKQLTEKASGITPTDREKTDLKIKGTIKKLFLDYNLDYTTVNIITDNGSPLDYILYEIEEKHGNIVVNRAVIGYGIDGSLTSFGGTHNKLDDFKGSDNYSEAQIINIAYDYLASNKSKIEAAMIPSEDSGTDMKTYNDDEVVPPDGIKSIDEVVEVKLPEYKLELNNYKDLKDISIMKEMFNGSIVWKVNFTLNTSWGKVDSIFNPLINMKIDAMTGNIIEVISTDGI